MSANVYVAAPDIFRGDAVGNHCHGLVRVFRRASCHAEAYAQRGDEDVHAIADLARGIDPRDTVIVSYSIFDPFLQHLLDLPCRRVCYFHGVTSPELLREYEPATAELCERSLNQLPLLRNFDRVIVNSRFSANALVAMAGEMDFDILPPLTADMPFFQSRLRESPSHRDGPLNILVVGRVVPHKRVEDAITIVAHLSSAGLDVTLTVVGPSHNVAYQENLEKQAKDQGISDRVFFLGAVSDDALRERFSVAGVFLSVSRHEGFCVPVVEAMYAGLPVFLRSGTGSSEVVGHAGFVFQELREAIEELTHVIAQPDRLSVMRLAGQRRAAEISATVIDNNIVDAFLRN